MMINCPECAHEISNTAAACPHCGHPFKKTKKQSGSGCLILIVAFIFLYGVVLALKDPTPSNDPIINTQASIADPELQKTYKSLLLGYIRTDILYKINRSSGSLQVYIGRNFNELNIDQKNVVMGVALKYYQNIDNQIGLISIYDSKSGKHIGRFSEQGLSID